MEQTVYRELGLIGAFLRFLDSHKLIARLLLIAETAAIIWAVFTYNFTTNI